jgi:hypothetical protein
MIGYHFSQDGVQSPVISFYQTIRGRLVCCGFDVVYIQTATKLIEELALKIRTTVCEDLQGHSMARKDGIKQYFCDSGCFLIANRKGFCPFGEVVDRSENVRVTVSGLWVRAGYINPNSFSRHAHFMFSM